MCICTLEDKEKALSVMLTDEVLEVMAEAVRVMWWSGDWVYTSQFVQGCYECAGKPCPDLTPYDEQLW